VGKRDLSMVTIPVTGMTCASCVRRVERALSRREGVAGATVNFAAEKATVEYDPEVASPGGFDRSNRRRRVRHGRARGKPSA
jgi:copper chaperone CopZ